MFVKRFSKQAWLISAFFNFLLEPNTHRSGYAAVIASYWSERSVQLISVNYADWAQLSCPGI
jgi:hypothetical protein